MACCASSRTKPRTEVTTLAERRLILQASCSAMCLRTLSPPPSPLLALIIDPLGRHAPALARQTLRLSLGAVLRFLAATSASTSRCVGDPRGDSSADRLVMRHVRDSDQDQSREIWSPNTFSRHRK